METATQERVDRLAELDQNGEYPERWAPEPGDSISGIVRRYTDVDLPVSGLTRLCVLERPNGDVETVFISATVLKGEFKKLRPRVGERVAIKYLGTPPNKNYKKFTVICPDRPLADEPEWDSYDGGDAANNAPPPRHVQEARAAAQAPVQREQPAPDYDPNDPFESDEAGVLPYADIVTVGGRKFGRR